MNLQSLWSWVALGAAVPLCRFALGRGGARGLGVLTAVSALFYLANPQGPLGLLVLAAGMAVIMTHTPRDSPPTPSRVQAAKMMPGRTSRRIRQKYQTKGFIPSRSGILDKMAPMSSMLRAVMQLLLNWRESTRNSGS